VVLVRDFGVDDCRFGGPPPHFCVAWKARAGRAMVVRHASVEFSTYSVGFSTLAQLTDASHAQEASLPHRTTSKSERRVRPAFGLQRSSQG